MKQRTSHTGINAYADNAYGRMRGSHKRLCVGRILTVCLAFATAFTLSCSSSDDFSSSSVGIYNAEDVEVDAKLLKEALCKYPALAKKRGIAGSATIYMVIDVDGNVAKTFVKEVEPAGFGFETEALAAVKQYKFSPALVGGVPVRQLYAKEFRFVP